MNQDRDENLDMGRHGRRLPSLRNQQRLLTICLFGSEVSPAAALFMPPRTTASSSRHDFAAAAYVGTLNMFSFTKRLLKTGLVCHTVMSERLLGAEVVLGDKFPNESAVAVGLGMLLGWKGGKLTW
jgi:hypothetical protein